MSRPKFSDQKRVIQTITFDERLLNAVKQDAHATNQSVSLVVQKALMYAYDISDLSQLEQTE